MGWWMCLSVDDPIIKKDFFTKVNYAKCGCWRRYNLLMQYLSCHFCYFFLMISNVLKNPENGKMYLKKVKFQIGLPLKKMYFWIIFTHTIDMPILYAPKQSKCTFSENYCILESNVGIYISSPYLNQFLPDVVYKSAPSVVPCLTLFTCKELHILLKNQYVWFVYPITGTASTQCRVSTLLEETYFNNGDIKRTILAEPVRAPGH